MRAILFFTFLISSCMSNSTENTNSSKTEQGEATTNSATMLYRFPEQGKGKWRVQDDVVMGGRSDSRLKMTDEGFAHFSGRVSLENNGGFCSIQQTTENNPHVLEEQATAFHLVVRGDGKNYNFRVRTPQGRHAYAFTFPTQKNDKWETIAIPFNAMEATYRGEPVDVPNYAGEDIVEMQLLIGNGKAESFEILVASIEVL